MKEEEEKKNGKEPDNNGNPYLALGLSMGMSFGLLFGMLFLDNIALGLCYGPAIGMGIAFLLKKANEGKKK